LSASLAEAAPPLVKPRLRGRLHQWGFLASIVTGTLLVALAPTGRARGAALVYAVSVSVLFGTSALYHRRNWSARRRSLMQRLDHAMILVLIAGSYTPVVVLMLPSSATRWTLELIWSGTAVGVALRLLWAPIPRWAMIPPYLLVSSVALLALPQLFAAAGAFPLVLMLGGGVIYLVGAVILALRRPDPRPEVFGYHEVFHLLTLVAGVAVYVLNSIAVYRA
jgi:hemolysin III